ncbi:MAG: phosphotransferase family protein [Actinomycetota bacterium]|nr:phosphotransferase family protein [Actinomycetota bacterium]
MDTTDTQAHTDGTATPGGTAQPDGIDVEAVTAYLAEHVPSLEPPLQWVRLPGGHSNLTYRIVGSSGREAVIRRPPQGELLPKAHDMWREYRIIAGLHPTGFPVPEPLAFCEDESVTGRPFYVMSVVPGKAIYTREEVEAYLDLDARRTLGFSFMEALAKLHSLDPDDIGLGELGRKENYVARQMSSWYRSWTSQAEGAKHDDPVIHQLYENLSAAIPEQGPARVVHGDCGLHNCMVMPDGTVSALLDWEIGTLGDPLADLAYALNSWARPSDAVANKEDAPTMADGFAERDELAAHYAERSGRDLSDLAFYETYNHFKTACIIHGVYARYMMGQKSTEGVDVEGLRERMLRCVELASASAKDADLL